MEELCHKLTQLCGLRNFDFFKTPKQQRYRQLEITLHDYQKIKPKTRDHLLEGNNLLPRIVLGCIEDDIPELFLLLFLVLRTNLTETLALNDPNSLNPELFSAFLTVYQNLLESDQKRYYNVVLAYFNKVCVTFQQYPTQDLLNYLTLITPYLANFKLDDLSPRYISVLNSAITASLNSSTFYRYIEPKISSKHMPAYLSLAHRTNSEHGNLVSVYRDLPATVTDPFLLSLANSRYSTALEIASLIKKSQEKIFFYPGLGTDIMFTALTQPSSTYDAGVLTISNKIYLECRKISRLWSSVEGMFISIISAKDPAEYKPHSDYLINKLPESKTALDLAYFMRKSGSWTLAELLTPGPFLAYTLPWTLTSDHLENIDESAPQWIHLYYRIIKSIDPNNFNRSLNGINDILQGLRNSRYPFPVHRYFLLLLTIITSRLHVLRGSVSDAKISLQHALMYAENLATSTTALVHSYSVCLNIVDFPKPFTDMMSINCYNLHQGGRIAKGKPLPQMPENLNVIKRIESLYESVAYTLKYSVHKSIARAQAYLAVMLFFYSSIAPAELTFTAKLPIAYLNKLSQLVGFSAASYEELYLGTSKLLADQDFQQIFSKFNSMHLVQQAKICTVMPRAFKGDHSVLNQESHLKPDLGVAAWAKLKAMAKIPPKTLRTYGSLSESDMICLLFNITQKLPTLLLSDLRQYLLTYHESPPKESSYGCPIAQQSFINDPEMRSAPNTITITTSHDPLCGSHCTYQSSKLPSYFIIALEDIIITTNLTWPVEIEPYENWRLDPSPVYSQKKVLRRGEPKVVTPLAPASAALRPLDHMSSLYIEYHRIMEEVGTQLSMPQGPGWWTKRAALDEALAQWCRMFEHIVIGPFGFLLRAEKQPAFLELAISPESQKLIQYALSFKLSDFTRHVIALTIMEREDLIELTPSFFSTTSSPIEITHPLYKEIVSILSRTTSSGELKAKHLVLSTPLAHLPLEIIPSLRDMTISRLPSRLWPAPTTDPSGSRYYLVNPDGSIKNTEDRMMPHLSSWNGVVGSPEQPLLSELDGKSVYLFCGHGIGAKYIPITRLHEVKNMPISLLMGCSSLGIPGNNITTAMFFRFMLNGAKSVVGTLSDVTDLDIDKLTIDLLKREPSPSVLTTARKSTTMYNLTGGMTICYGIH